MKFKYKDYDKEADHELFAIPGQLLTIPIAIVNELNQQTNTRLIIKQDQHSERIFSHNVTRVYGKPLDKTYLLLRTSNEIRNSYYKLNVSFLDCPPGFYFDPTANSCNCTADDRKELLGPIVKCNTSSFRALIVRGYWAGMYETRLYVSSHSQFSYMTPHYVNASYHTPTFLLPQYNSELCSFMCGEQRSGVLCGKCSENFSAYYHSNSYSCGPEGLCHLGILFYVLSELTPVVILFSIIVHFDVSFGSGFLNGLVFYCQIVDAATIDSDRFAVYLSPRLHTAVSVLQGFYKIIYGISNFEFFHIEPLSFCLWKNATTLDTIAIKYATTLFAFVLVFILVRIMNCQCST